MRNSSGETKISCQVCCRLHEDVSRNKIATCEPSRWMTRRSQELVQFCTVIYTSVGNKAYLHGQEISYVAPNVPMETLHKVLIS